MIVPMKHMTLFALKTDERRIMRAIQDASALQIESAEDIGKLVKEGDSEAASFTRVCENELNGCEEKVSRIKSAIAKLSSSIEGGGMLTPEPVVSKDELVGSVDPAISLCNKLDGLMRDLVACKTERDKRLALIGQIKPFSSMDVAVEDIRSTRHTEVSVGIINADKLHVLDDADVAYQAFGSEGKIPVIIVLPKVTYEQSVDALKASGFSETSLPQISGTPKENIMRLERECKGLTAEYERIDEQIKALGAEGDVLKKGYDGALIERDRFKARVELFATRKIFILTGWVRSDETNKLIDAIRSVTDVCHIDIRDPLDEEQPPTAVKNNKFLAPFEFVTNMYSPPDPRGYDPTAVMAPFYLLFFGLMMGDTGYGIVITLLSLLMLKIKKPRKGIGQICRILVWGGLSTAVCGLLTGTFFGMGWKELFGDGFMFPLLDPMIDQLEALILYCGLGFAQIIAGMIVSIVLHLKKGDWQTSLFDIGSWLMIFAGAGLAFVLKGGLTYVAYGLVAIGLVLIIVFGGRAKKGFGRVTGGLGKLYDITGFFSDVLSYARVFALGLATGVMGSVFNMIGAMIDSAFAGIPLVGPIIGFIVAGALLVVLHLFCIAINALGAFIHCARLQFIEYYNRFYTPGGKLFSPLGLYTKHNKVN